MRVRIIKRKLRIVKLNSLNGEVHFIVEESCAPKFPLNSKKYIEIEAIKVTKKEASKPFLLLRE